MIISFIDQSVRNIYFLRMSIRTILILTSFISHISSPLSLSLLKKKRLVAPCYSFLLFFLSVSLFWHNGLVVPFWKKQQTHRHFSSVTNFRNIRERSLIPKFNLFEKKCQQIVQQKMSRTTKMIPSKWPDLDKSLLGVNSIFKNY